MAQDIQNPADLPHPLNSAERKFVRCMREGIDCVIGDGNLPNNFQPSWSDALSIRGEVIRFFACGGSTPYRVRGATIGLVGAIITGNTDLEFIKTPYVLGFMNCQFSGKLNLRGTECFSLLLTGSQLLQGLNAEGIVVKDHVVLNNGFFSLG